MSPALDGLNYTSLFLVKRGRVFLALTLSVILFVCLFVRLSFSHLHGRLSVSARRNGRRKFFGIDDETTRKREGAFLAC